MMTSQNYSDVISRSTHLHHNHDLVRLYTKIPCNTFLKNMLVSEYLFDLWWTEFAVGPGPAAVCSVDTAAWPWPAHSHTAAPLQNMPQYTRGNIISWTKSFEK